jgi:hypothetical protein
VSIIYRTTLTPSKLELLSAWLPTRTWYRVTGRPPELAKAGGFRVDDPEGEVGIEFMVALDDSGPEAVAYLVPMTYRAAPLDGSDEALIGTTEHGVLGRRWVYDGTRDPVLVTQLVALIQGEAEPQAQGESHTPDPTVHTAPIVADPVSASGFTALDGVTGTEVGIKLAGTGAGPDGAGELVLRVARILAPASLEAATVMLAGQGYGYVTATWRPAEGAPVRGVFATAELR